MSFLMIELSNASMSPLLFCSFISSGMYLLAKPAVDKQLPALVLHLVEEEILEITLYPIQGIKYTVKIVGFHACQPVVIEVGIGKFLSPLPYELLSQGRFPTSAHAYHNLGKVARRRKLPLLHSAAQQRQVVRQQFFLLVGKDGGQSSRIHKSIFHICLQR